MASNVSTGFAASTVHLNTVVSKIAITSIINYWPNNYRSHSSSNPDVAVVSQMCINISVIVFSVKMHLMTLWPWALTFQPKIISLIWYPKVTLYKFMNTLGSRASAMLKHVLDIGWTSVRLSVCLSVTRWYCIKTDEHIVMLSLPHNSPFILVLCLSRSSRNSDGVTPCVAAKQRWGVKIS